MDQLTAYCGVNCAACPDYTGGVCASCQLSEWTEDNVCMPVKCCREKDIACCAFCESFPCGGMAEFYEESESHREAYKRMCALRAGQADPF